MRENNPFLNKTILIWYDKGGNLTAKREYVYTTGTLGTPTATHSYVYGNAYKDLLTSYDGQTITYDKNARPTSYKGNALTWMLGNLYEYGETKFFYLYDGSRWIKTNGNAMTYYDYYNGRLLGEYRSNGSTYKKICYLYDHAGIMGFTLNGTVYRYIKNLQGDIIAIYQGGTKVAEYVYDAWGNCTIKQDTNGIGTLNAIRYRGYYYDVETGLYYLLSRYYDPATGRWLSPDTLLSPFAINGLNLFYYCFNNPVMYVDYDGFVARKIINHVNPYIAIDNRHESDEHIHITQKVGNKSISYSWNLIGHNTHDSKTNLGLNDVSNSFRKELIRKGVPENYFNSLILDSNILDKILIFNNISIPPFREFFPVIQLQIPQEFYPILEEKPNIHEEFPIAPKPLPNVHVDPVPATAGIGILLFDALLLLVAAALILI